MKADALDEEKLDLIKEAISLNSFNHPNLIKFHGICIESFNPKFIVLEYMNLGDLLTYLRQMRDTKVYKNYYWLKHSKIIFEKKTNKSENILNCQINNLFNDFDRLFKNLTKKFLLIKFYRIISF